MRIKVTKRDIERGVRYSAWNSPIGYAFAREFGSEYSFVGSTICLSNGLCIDLRDCGLEEQTAFDTGKELDPFELFFSAEAIYRSRLKT